MSRRKSLLAAASVGAIVGGLAFAQTYSPIQNVLQQVQATGATFYRSVQDLFADTLDVKDFGLYPISVNGETDCTWVTSAGTTTVTCPSKTWTFIDQALLSLFPTGFKVELQAAGPGGVDLHTYIASMNVGATTFTTHDAATTDSGTGANRLTQVLMIQPSGNNGTKYHIGATITVNTSGVTSQVAAPTGQVADVSVASAAVNSGGSLGSGTGTADCAIAAPLSPLAVGGPTNTSYALGGVQAVLRETITAGTLTGFSTVVVPGNYTRISTTYPYTIGGAYSAVPVSSSCTNITGGVTPPINVLADLTMNVQVVQSTLGLDTTSGVFVGNGNQWGCNSGSPAPTTTSGGDHGTGLTVKCSVQKVHVWAGFDNSSRLGAMYDILTATPNWLRPQINLCNFYYTLPIDVGQHPIIGAATFHGCGGYRSGFFEPSDGTHWGQIFPFVDVGQNGSVSNTGNVVSDLSVPDQSGAVVEDLTFLGEQTGSKSTTRSVDGIRFYGSSGKSKGVRLSSRNLPGCLWCGGADTTGTGNISESILSEIMVGDSGDAWSRTPVIGCDAVGVNQAGCNNFFVVGLRGDGNFGSTFAVRGATGGGGGGSIIHVDNMKDEAGGNDEFTKAPSFVEMNYDCDGTLTGTAYSFPQYNGTGQATTVITSSAGGGTLCGGVADVRIQGSLANIPLNHYAVVIGGLHKVDVNSIRLDDVTLNASTGLGGGVLVNACNSSCVLITPKMTGVTDYPLIVTASPNASTIATNAMELDVPISGAGGFYEDNGLTTYCNFGSGISSSTSGLCQNNIGQVTGSFVDGTLSLAGSSSGTGVIHAPASPSNWSWTLPGNSSTLVGYGVAGSFAAAQTFPQSDLLLQGSSTGKTTLNSGLAGAGNNTLTLPTETTDTLVDLTGTQTLTSKTLTSPTINGTPTGTWIGTSGSTLGLLNTANTFSATDLFTGSGAPSLAAGTTFICGACSPTFGANGEAGLYESTTGGAIIQGDGSTDDLEFKNNAGSIIFKVTSGGSNLNLNANGINAVGTYTANNASGPSIVNATASGTTATVFPNRAGSAGIGATSTTVGTLIASTTDVNEWSSSGFFFKVITTGTNADTLCMATGGLAQIQASTCTISSKRFKNLFGKFQGSALDLIGQLDVWNFSYKAKNPDPNGNLKTVGIMAEDVAKYMPQCAIFEKDMKTPKSYKPECLIGMLVKGEQELHKQLTGLGSAKQANEVRSLELALGLFGLWNLLVTGLWLGRRRRGG